MLSCGMSGGPIELSILESCFLRPLMRNLTAINIKIVKCKSVTPTCHTVTVKPNSLQQNQSMLCL